MLKGRDSEAARRAGVGMTREVVLWFSLVISNNMSVGLFKQIICKLNLKLLSMKNKLSVCAR